MTLRAHGDLPNVGPRSRSTTSSPSPSRSSPGAPTRPPPCPLARRDDPTGCRGREPRSARGRRRGRAGRVGRLLARLRDRAGLVRCGRLHVLVPRDGQRVDAAVRGEVRWRERGRGDLFEAPFVDAAEGWQHVSVSFADLRKKGRPPRRTASTPRSRGGTR
ncbi:hypothetical protein NKG05_15400 [Oerskovia sp. M15]